MSQKKDRTASGAAIAGAGATTAGVGLAAGGVPGAKSDFSSVFRMKPGDRSGGPVRRARTTVQGALPAAKATPGGILGFRISAHEGGTYGFREEAKAKPSAKARTNKDAFFRARNEGKIAPEEKILRQMSRGRKAANLAFLGGTAATAHGVNRMKESRVHKAQRHQDQWNGALAGAGAAGATISHGGTKVLTGQKRKWEKKAINSVDEAGRLVPGIAGREGKRLTLKQMDRYKRDNPGKPWPKTMKPSVSDSAIKNQPQLLNGATRANVRRAGELRGAAAQQRHFAEVYGNTAKVVSRFRTPSLVAGATGAGGLAASKWEERERRVKKSATTSAFGVDHG